MSYVVNIPLLLAFRTCPPAAGMLAFVSCRLVLSSLSTAPYYTQLFEELHDLHLFLYLIRNISFQTLQS